jgi:hypothetical protein
MLGICARTEPSSAEMSSSQLITSDRAPAPARWRSSAATARRARRATGSRARDAARADRVAPRRAAEGPASAGRPVSDPFGCAGVRDCGPCGDPEGLAGRSRACGTPVAADDRDMLANARRHGPAAIVNGSGSGRCLQRPPASA